MEAQLWRWREPIGPKSSWRLSCCLRSIVWCRLRCSLTKSSICRLRSCTWWLICSLRCCSLLCFCRFIALCLQPTKRVAQVTYTWNIRENEYSSKYGNTYSFWFSKFISSLPWSFTSDACLASSCIMSFFLALPTLDCLVHLRNSIRVPWLFRISFSLLWWSDRWFIHMRSNRSSWLVLTHSNWPDIGCIISL